MRTRHNAKLVLLDLIADVYAHSLEETGEPFDEWLEAFDRDMCEAADGRYDPQLVDQLVAVATRLQRAASVVRSRYEQLLADTIGHDDAIRLGDDVLTVRPKTRTRCERELLADWLGDDYATAVRISADGSNVSKRALDAIAKLRGSDPRTVRDTFLHVDESPDEHTLTRMPVDKAPKYQQRLSHGERVSKIKRGKT